MPYTVEELKREVFEEYLGKLTPEQLLARVPVEQRLEGVPDEQRLAGLSVEKIAKGLSDQDKDKLRELLNPSPPPPTS